MRAVHALVRHCCADDERCLPRRYDPAVPRRYRSIIMRTWKPRGRARKINGSLLGALHQAQGRAEHVDALWENGNEKARTVIKI